MDAEVLKAIKLSYIANRFFNCSRSWICQKVNHNIKNGKPDGFNDKELQVMKQALSTIADELKELSERL